MLLTRGYWERRFGGDAGVVGESLAINGRPHAIVGVMPRNFRFDSAGAFEVVLPLQVNRAAPAGWGMIGGEIPLPVRNRRNLSDHQL